VSNPEVLIRKYSDRRLYDTAASRYVKLEDIARMVREGVNVRVVDGRSGKDITHIIFTQIIVEDAREREIALPLQLLTQLVRASDKATHDFLTWYLNSTLDLYKKAQDTVHTRLSSAKSAVASPLDFVRNLLSGYTGASPATGDSEVESLRRRVEELQSRLEQREERASRAPKRKRPARKS
jgi:polyhydroxyalkanoate synthesis repressor PhaR